MNYRVRIDKVSDPKFWYASSVGKEFKVVCYYPEDECFLVRDNEGHLNIIKAQDITVLKEL